MKYIISITIFFIISYLSKLLMIAWLSHTAEPYIGEEIYKKLLDLMTITYLLTGILSGVTFLLIHTVRNQNNNKSKIDKTPENRQ